MGYFIYHLVQSAVAISSNRVAAILSLLFSQVNGVFALGPRPCLANTS